MTCWICWTCWFFKGVFHSRWQLMRQSTYFNSNSAKLTIFFHFYFSFQWRFNTDQRGRRAACDWIRSRWRLDASAPAQRMDGRLCADQLHWNYSLRVGISYLCMAVPSSSSHTRVWHSFEFIVWKVFDHRKKKNCCESPPVLCSSAACHRTAAA